MATLPKVLINRADYQIGGGVALGLRTQAGPITEQGKQRSRCNAIRHGLTAETVIGALEDAEDYKAFEAAIADYDAQAHPVPGGPNKMGNEGQ